MSFPNEILTNEIMDCPICMEAISGHNNKVSTECGHCFHTNCLMKSVAHNGFGCPYCRTAMAEKQEENEDEESIWSDEEEDEEMFDDDALRGFRFFFNNLENIEHDSKDLEEEDRMEEEEESDLEEVNNPSVRYVTQKLIEQGVTMEHLVRSLLSGHDEYMDDEDLEEQMIMYLDNFVLLFLTGHQKWKMQLLLIQSLLLVILLVTVLIFFLYLRKLLIHLYLLILHQREK